MSSDLRTPLLRRIAFPILTLPLQINGRLTGPRPRDDKTIALVPQDAPTPGTTDGSGSNIGSGTATGGTSPWLLIAQLKDILTAI